MDAVVDGQPDGSHPTTDMLALRRALGAHFTLQPIAWSSDGAEVRFVGPLGLPVSVGGFAVVERADDPLVVQVRDVRTAERDGATVELDKAALSLGADIAAATVRPIVRYVTGVASPLGVLSDTTFTNRRTTQPFGEEPMRPLRADELQRVLDGLLDTSPSIAVGTVPDTSVPARIKASGFSRHTFMCGQSGSGKTYTTGVLFERLLAGTTLPILIIDPNSDHVLLGAVSDSADDPEATSRHAAVAAGVRVARARGHDADFVLCLDMSDLPLDAQALLLRLDPVTDLDEFATLRRLGERLGPRWGIDDLAAAAAADPSTAALATRIDNLGLRDWGLWRRDDEPSLVELRILQHRCVVLDVGTLATSTERHLVALGLLTGLWEARARRTPVLIAIDEAHNVVPATSSDPLLRVTSDVGARIAAEGRKFGLHLFLATQRPGKVNPQVVSQCDNLVLMRMNGSADIDELATSFSHVPDTLLRRATEFALGQALLAGPISPVPLVVQVGRRVSPEGGADVPTTWTSPP